MSIEENHDGQFERICEEHDALISSLETYTYSRRENAEVGEISVQHNHRMICIAPSTNRGPLWAVEGIAGWFSLHVGERYNYPLRVYTVGYCLKIYSSEQTIRMLINDERSKINGKEILIPIEHIGRYFLVNKEDLDYYSPSLQLKKYREGNQE